MLWEMLRCVGDFLVGKMIDFVTWGYIGGIEMCFEHVKVVGRAVDVGMIESEGMVAVVGVVVIGFGDSQDGGWEETVVCFDEIS